MNPVAEWYRTLDLEPGASPQEVRDAWRDLAQVWHPDRFSHNDRLRAKAEQNLQRINEAYERLKDLRSGARPAVSDRYQPSPTPDPTRPEPLDALADGPLAWNLWRSKYSDVIPDLRGVRLNRRELESVDFRECDLTGAGLERADLYKANLSHAKLEGARLIGADLGRAILQGTDLRGAELSDVELSSADLRGADLRGAVLRGARLIGARLEGADLRGAVGADPKQLALCSVDAATRLP